MTETHSGSCQVCRSGSWLKILAVGRNPKTTLLRAVALAVACLIVFRWMLLPVRAEGISMTPTYANHSVHFINRLSYLFHEPRRGDVVGIRLTAPDGSSAPHILYFKRIIGLPGEAISFVHGQVLVDGRPLDEPYQKGPCDWNLAPVALLPGEYFVVGDNRSMPQEAHLFGRAQRTRIVGKALL